MSDKKLTVLAIVAVAMVVLTLVQSYVANQSQRPDKMDTYLIQGLNTADVAVIELGAAGGEGTTLKRLENSDRFVVENRDNYPATTAKINNLMASCLDIQVTELVTNNSDNHHDLEVSEEKSKNVIKFLAADGNLITGLIVGKRDNQAGGTYVRKLDNDPQKSNQVYIASQVQWLQNSAMSYIEKELIKAKTDNIAEVTVSNPQGSYSIIEEENGNVVLLNMPQGKKEKATDYKRVFEVVTDLDFSDVRRRSSETDKIVFDHKYVCRLKDSRVYTFELAKTDDKTLTRCKCEFTDTEPITKEKGVVESPEQLEAKEAKLLARDAAEQFNQKHDGWIYEVTSWKATNMTKKFDDLLENIEEAKPEESAKPVDEGESKDQ